MPAPTPSISVNDFNDNTRLARPAPGPAPAVTVFDRTTHAQRLDEDRFALHIGSEWNVWRGPNGGYLAALLLQTLTRRLADPGRRPRVLTVHYPKVPVAGPVEIRTSLLRTGRSMSWLGADLYQGEQLCVTARAAFSAPWPGVEYSHLQPPPVPALADTLTLPAEFMPPFARQYEYHSAFGAPLQPGQSDAVGGYIRPSQQRAYDAPLLAALSDAWYPASFARDARPVMAATLDLTVHFRGHAALDVLRPGDHVLGVFRSRLATEGFFEEDGELWSPGGELLAQSRQLAIAAPLVG